MSEEELYKLALSNVHRYSLLNVILANKINEIVRKLKDLSNAETKDI